MEYWSKMTIFEQHEIFEIEVLKKLKNNHLLSPLVFGGGTMLRLCYELNRYSADLDFWFIKERDVEEYFNKIIQTLGRDYEITDSRLKFYTLLFEIRANNYPKKLKIEIRKEIKECDFQDTIAFSKYSTIQVILRAFTLEQIMKNKIDAFLDRGEIRDCFDIEFLLRKGIPLPEQNNSQILEISRRLNNFKKSDFKVKLGSILEQDIRQYYIKNRFNLLEQKIRDMNEII